MASLKGFVLSAAADRDLEEIFDYTVKKFGEAQAIKYLIELEAIFLDLTANPGLGRSRDEIRPGLKSLPKTSHVIFYRISGEQLIVVRVLHGSRDVPRVFNERD